MVDGRTREYLRDLAKRYVELCASERNQRLIPEWRRHNSLKPGRPMVICGVFIASQIEDEIVQCLPPPRAPREYRHLEHWLQTRLWRSTIPDDMVYEPWCWMHADLEPAPPGYWGIPLREVHDQVSGGSRYLPVVTKLEDLAGLRATQHRVINDNTEAIRRTRDLIGDIMPLHIYRATEYMMWLGTDLAMALGAMVGMEELMFLLYDQPELIHRMMAFMRDAVMANLGAGEAAGDWSTADGNNYWVPRYVEDLPDPQPAAYEAPLSDLWFFSHAQEFEGVSPAQFEEFLLAYQLPIMERFGLVNYGCCETLNDKIDSLRKIPNLRRILMGPLADLQDGCRQIGGDYVVSWRPSPAMVSVGFDPEHVRGIIRSGFEQSRGTNVEVMLKEMLTIENDPGRLFQWARIAKEEAERAMERTA